MTRGYGDFHSHLAPGVDDGSPTMEDALHSVDRMVGAGVRRIVTTPHMPASLAREPRRFGAFLDRIEERWAALRVLAVREHPELDFRLGAEVRLDTAEPDVSDPRIRLGGTSFVLVEWAGFRAPTGSPEGPVADSGWRALRTLRDEGFLPVIAHPERYAGIDAGLDAVRAWKDAGAFLQGTYGSLVGQYGSVAQALIRRMLEEGLLDYLSSDFHGRPRYVLYISQGADKLRQFGGDRQLDLLAKENPARLFANQSPLPVPPLPVEGPLAALRNWAEGRAAAASLQMRGAS